MDWMPVGEATMNGAQEAVKSFSKRTEPEGDFDESAHFYGSMNKGLARSPDLMHLVPPLQYSPLAEAPPRPRAVAAVPFAGFLNPIRRFL
ncbi:MAG: hypothetical protein HY705_00425 [Gemmatimonadetes bacterium]|nr:hypothetical protein [Gemmatimonadota bacterium]